jgi:hypothetical protein
MGRHALGAIVASAVGIVVMVLALLGSSLRSAEQLAYALFYAFLIAFAPGCVVAWLAGLATSYSLSRVRSAGLRRVLVPLAGAGVGSVLIALWSIRTTGGVDVAVTAGGLLGCVLASLTYSCVSAIRDDGRGRDGIGWWEEPARL